MKLASQAIGFHMRRSTRLATARQYEARNHLGVCCLPLYLVQLCIRPQELVGNSRR